MKSSSFIGENRAMRLLIVEDEEKLAVYLKKGLSKEGYLVDYYLNAEEAEEYINIISNSFDLLILDNMLSGKSGIEFAKSLRKQHIFLPILMLTAKDSPEDIVTALDAGIDDYLTKPFSFEVMLARIRALLRRPMLTHASHHELKRGNLVLNMTTRKVVYVGKELSLTLKEYSLLEYLLMHPNEVFDREHLLEKMWDINFDSFSNVVDVHIKNLRKKLKEVANEEILETIRGVGYRLKK